MVRRGSRVRVPERAYCVRFPRTDETERSWRKAALEWSKAEVARLRVPVVIQIPVPVDLLLGSQFDRIVRRAGCPPELQQTMNGTEVTLRPDVASKYLVGVEPVAPCTCWRDGTPCEACAHWRQSPGGWNGTFLPCA
jgi:hypothetical protein